LKIMKKSFNLAGDIAQRVDDFIDKNPGVSFTLLVNQALLQWLKNPQVTLNTARKMTKEDVKKFMEENKDLMKDLSK
jgi:hypothetical protein